MDGLHVGEVPDAVGRAPVGKAARGGEVGLAGVVVVELGIPLGAVQQTCHWPPDSRVMTRLPASREYKLAPRGCEDQM